MSNRVTKSEPGMTGKHGGYPPVDQGHPKGRADRHGQGGSGLAAHGRGWREQAGAARVGSASERNVAGWPVAAVLAGAFIWSYWPTLTDLWTFWQANADYSAGQLVPLVALYVLWTERKQYRNLRLKPCWWGLVVLLAAQAVRFYGLYDMYGSLERYSMVLSVAGACLFIGGIETTKRLKWLLLFLFLMLPLPNRVHNRVALPMQDFATTSAVFGLELLGYLVAREGNVLTMSAGNTIAVAEACSGLRMLTAFVIVGAALAFVVHRPAWQKAVVVLSTLPVAVAANTGRLIVTAVLYESVGGDVGRKFFHDFAGLTMMPFAVIVLVLDLQLLRWLAGGAGVEKTGK